ncbi:MAG: TVP38/TMEM64 family protein [Planctomyces sp.]|jgi:uncharacterized membrane protein YdjX (TVP38/TMEM64 family)
MDSQPAISNSPITFWKKLLMVSVVTIVAFMGYRHFSDRLNLQYLAAQEAQLRVWQQDSPALVYGAAFLIYVAVTGLSLPGAAVLTLTCGWFFGFWRGLLLVSFASTAGATTAFLVSRFLLRDSIQQRFGERMETFNQSLEREGAFYLFMLRLIPAVPFFVINLVMGLTPVRTRTYWWVSQLGMLPGTAVYIYAGSSVPNLTTLTEKGATGVLSPRLLLAFAMLGIVPLVLKKMVERFRPTVSVETAGKISQQQPSSESGIPASPHSDEHGLL